MSLLSWSPLLPSLMSWGLLLDHLSSSWLGLGVKATIDISCVYFFLIVENKNVGHTPILQLCSWSSCFLKVLSAETLISGTEFNPSQEMRTHLRRQRVHFQCPTLLKIISLPAKTKKRSEETARHVRNTAPWVPLGGPPAPPHSDYFF